MGSAIAAHLPTATTMSLLLSSSFKAALLLVLSWLGVVLLRRGTAAARHQLWALGVAGALLVPLLSWTLPSLPLSLDSAPTGAAGALEGIAVFVIGDGRATSATSSWQGWLAILWGAGGLLVSLRFLRAHLAARRLLRRAEPARAGSWLSARREAAAELAMRADIVLCRVEGLSSPMTIGVLRPRVLLPTMAEAWSPERLRAVLIHELAHVRRRDTLIQLGAQLACVLYWWNPLAWLAAARLRIEREHACDDRVLRAGIWPSNYASDLLELARGLSPDEAALAGAISMPISMMDGSRTESRLRRILDPGTPRGPRGAGFRFAARATTLGFAVTFACFGPPEDPGVSPKAVAAVERAFSGGDDSLWLGSPRIATDLPPSSVAEDPIDAISVANEVQRHVADLEQCYARRLLVHPRLRGTIVVRWTIVAGMVLENTITADTLGDEEIRACVEILGEAVQFPASPGSPTQISFPFSFGERPSGDGC